jgi:hypothetical protein
MSTTNQVSIGIDPSGGRAPITFAVLDETGALLRLSAGDVQQVFEFIDQNQSAWVAINAPRRPNKGLVRERLQRMAVSPTHLRGADMRTVEFELKERGLSISPTPGRVELCPAWMQIGFSLYAHLADLGYASRAGGEAGPVSLETHPHLTYHALLGQAPLPKPSLEGRLQRQLALFAAGIGIKDPMDFFEEITRHKLLKGELPMEMLYLAEELDALAAAYVAHLVREDAASVEWIGDEREGQIAVPIRNETMRA